LKAVLSCTFVLSSLVLLTATVAVVQATDFSALDELASSEMKRLGVPGASIAIVKDGNLVHVRGYGVRSVEEAEAFTRETEGRQAASPSHSPNARHFSEGTNTR
jgi:CubicO group peptidase (beta-lactamase class C family)